MICIISFHEKGFWGADVYLTDDSAVPDWNCTGKIGDDMFGVINITNKIYPGITFLQGITGICDYCGEEYIYDETECECGGVINSPT